MQSHKIITAMNKCLGLNEKTKFIPRFWGLTMLKKIMFLLFLSFTISFATMAQTEVQVTKTITPAQKVHDTFSRHKHYKGYKVKTKSPYRKI